jgi:hypothetical protein
VDDTERRRQQKYVMPNVRLEGRHTANGRLLPDRSALIDRMKRGAVVAELGVADGDFSAEILARAEPACLHLIDQWQGARYGDGAARVAERFGDEIARDRVVVHQGPSVEMLDRLADASLDWVYIDTTHDYALTARELRMSARKVGPDGRIAGHDFCTGNIITAIVYGVVQAVNEFCLREGWQYEYLTLESHGHFSFCLMRL